MERNTAGPRVALVSEATLLRAAGLTDPALHPHLASEARQVTRELLHLAAVAADRARPLAAVPSTPTPVPGPVGLVAHATMPRSQVRAAARSTCGTRA